MRNSLVILGLVATLGCASDKPSQAATSGDTDKAGQPTAAESAKAPDATPTDTADRRALAPSEATPTSGTAGEPRSPLARLLQREPEYREVTIPAGTVLPLTLKTTVASDASHVEDPVHATTRRAVMVKGVEVIPAGTAVSGHVTTARRSARVKGRAAIAMRCNQIDLPGEGGRMAVKTTGVSRLAPATKKRDAMEIAAGTAGGAIVGGVIGGGKGAAKGAAVGGAGGTGVVLATRGKEVRLGAGAPVSVRLTAPLTIRVRMK